MYFLRATAVTKLKTVSHGNICICMPFCPPWCIFFFFNKNRFIESFSLTHTCALIPEVLHLQEKNDKLLFTDWLLFYKNIFYGSCFSSQIWYINSFNVLRCCPIRHTVHSVIYKLLRVHSLMCDYKQTWEIAAIKHLRRVAAAEPPGNHFCSMHQPNPLNSKCSHRHQ